MKARLGGLLTVALGAVLITNGIHGGDAGVIGGPPPSCGAASIGIAAPCPTGTITVDEVTTAVTPAALHASTPTPPAGGWQVTITSTCLDPATSNPVSQTLSVPNNGSATSAAVYVYTDTTSTTHCSYAVAQTAVAGFTTTYTPAPPISITYNGTPAGSHALITVTNSFVATTSTPPPSSSSAPASSSAATTPVASPSSSSGNLADTGPRTRITTSLYLGVGLVLLGLVMLFGGRFRRTGRRT